MTRSHHLHNELEIDYMIGRSACCRAAFIEVMRNDQINRINVYPTAERRRTAWIH